MTVSTLLLLAICLLCIGAFPAWPHSRNWGYGPAGGLGSLVVLLIALRVLGYI